MIGAVSALGLPFAIPDVGHGPLLEFLPRELFLLIGVAHLYRGRRAYANGLGYFAVALFWLMVPMVRHGPMNVTQALLSLALLVVYCALYWGLVPHLAWLAQRLIGPWTAFAAAVLTVDWARSWIIGAFPWAEWCWAMTRDLPLVQLASITGSHGITALIALSGAALVDGHKRPKSAAALASLLVVIHIWGATRLTNVSADAEMLRVGIAQGNIPQDIKNQDLDYAAEIAATYERLTAIAVSEGAQLVVWPEAAWPRRPSAESELFAYHPTVPLIAGVATLDFDDQDRAHVKNSAFAIDTEGVITGRYDKIALVPFGEYVPFARYLHMAQIVPELGELDAGDNPSPLGAQKLGILICYDGIFPRIARAEVASGARLLVNMTNDAWYDDSSGPYHHRDVYVLRAVETDRWLVRATNTGISTVVDPRGHTTLATALGTQTVVVQPVGLRDGRTVYVRFGDMVVWLALATILAGGVLRAIESARRDNSWAVQRAAN